MLLQSLDKMEEGRKLLESVCNLQGNQDFQRLTLYLGDQQTKLAFLACKIEGIQSARTQGAVNVLGELIDQIAGADRVLATIMDKEKKR